jgi:hypothetical protein
MCTACGSRARMHMWLTVVRVDRIGGTRSVAWRSDWAVNIEGSSIQVRPVKRTACRSRAATHHAARVSVDSHSDKFRHEGASIRWKLAEG